MRTNRSRGFTLIELLVVIAIIGILSAVVLASLSTARNKGSDASVQSNLSTIQTQAELYYGGAGNNSYGTQAFGSTCNAGVFSDSSELNAIASAKNSAKGNTIACVASGSSYVFQAQVNGTTTNATYWCVDSSGNSKYDYIALATGAIVCP